MTVINFVMALACEARPVIEYYKLKRVHSVKCFEFYKNNNIQLIVSGIGKGNAAVATGFLAGLDGSDTKAWLNAGIAGGNYGQRGDLVLANSIIDEETGNSYYPSVCFDCDIPQAGVITVNQAKEKYSEQNLYDMEAAGFYHSAVRFSTSELVHSCKIVSDNSDYSVSTIDKELVSALIKDQLEVIDQLVEILLANVALLATDPVIDYGFVDLVGRYRFTESQKNQLRLLLQNWCALNQASSINDIPIKDFKGSKELLAWLQHSIKTSQVCY